MEKNVKKSLFSVEDVELAQRYLNALKDVEFLKKELNWNEDDVVFAERYASFLQQIEEKI